MLRPQASACHRVEPGFPGDTRYYPFWYRDPTHPDGIGVGLTNGMAVTFCN
ncbi:MAG: hypothetical protein ABGY71_06020 [bacterium]